jgi:hypothetical protein
MSWVLSCTIVWAIGVFVIFQPTIRYILPYVLTRLGTIALIFIVASLSIIINTVLIVSFISNEDIDNIINIAIFGSTVNNMFLFAWFYIIVAITLLMNLDFDMNKISHLFTISFLEYFIEMLLIFILPVAFLFWTDVTYGFRILLGVISVSVGLSIFVQRMSKDSKILQKASATLIYIAVIVIVNSTIVNSFGIDRIPETGVKASIGENKILLNMEAKNVENPLFQLSNNLRNGKTSVYKIIASIPLVGLNLGYKIATIPSREFTIKRNNAQYTVYDEYNHQELLKLEKEVAK